MVDPAPISGSAMMAVLITLALMAAVAWFLRQTAAARRGAKSIAVETAVPLGERRSLVVVTVEGRRLLLGMTPTQVSLVTELTAAPAKSFESVLDESTRSDG
jgi:flagellar protein FliO/FliZ